MSECTLYFFFPLKLLLLFTKKRQLLQLLNEIYKERILPEDYKSPNFTPISKKKE